MFPCSGSPILCVTNIHNECPFIIASSYYMLEENTTSISQSIFENSYFNTLLNYQVTGQTHLKSLLIGRLMVQ